MLTADSVVGAPRSTATVGLVVPATGCHQVAVLLSMALAGASEAKVVLAEKAAGKLDPVAVPAELLQGHVGVGVGARRGDRRWPPGAGRWR